MTEDELFGCHHRLNRHEFEQTPGDVEGHGSLACHIPWSHKELDTVEQLNNTKVQDRQGDVSKVPQTLVLNPCPLSSVPIVGFLVVIVQ